MGRAAAGEPSAPAGSVGRDVTLGRIAGPFGIRGWVKVRSYTDPREGILRYQAWHVDVPRLGIRILEPLEGRLHGEWVVARLKGVEDRDAASELAHRDVRVPRADLPPPGEGRYYWADLEGLRVVNRDGADLGRVDYLLETGANDVLVIQGDSERLIPFVIDEVVLDVDLAGGVITVDWEWD